MLSDLLAQTDWGYYLHEDDSDYAEDVIKDKSMSVKVINYLL